MRIQRVSTVGSESIKAGNTAQAGQPDTKRESLLQRMLAKDPRGADDVINGMNKRKAEFRKMTTDVIRDLLELKYMNIYEAEYNEAMKNKVSERIEQHTKISLYRELLIRAHNDAVATLQRMKGSRSLVKGFDKADADGHKNAVKSTVADLARMNTRNEEERLETEHRSLNEADSQKVTQLMFFS